VGPVSWKRDCERSGRLLRKAQGGVSASLYKLESITAIYRRTIIKFCLEFFARENNQSQHVIACPIAVSATEYFMDACREAKRFCTLRV